MTSKRRRRCSSCMMQLKLQGKVRVATALMAFTRAMSSCLMHMLNCACFAPGIQTAFGAIERGAGQAAAGVRKGAEAVAKTATQGAEAVAKTATEGAEAFSKTASEGAQSSAQSVLRAKNLAKRVEQLARRQALAHFSTGFKLLLFFALNASLVSATAGGRAGH